MPKKLTQEQFLEKVKLVHGDTYICNDTYDGNTKKVEVICKVHGVFKISPLHLMTGHGCAKCAGKNKTHSEFLNEIKDNHPNLDIIGEYEKATSKIEVNCKIHNFKFLTTPTNLKNGIGCKKCSNTYRRTTEDFKLEMKEKWGKRFEVLGEFVNSSTNIKVCCDKGHEIESNPLELLKSGCCYKCSNKGRRALKTTEQFIKEAKEIHGDLYEYDEVNYKSALKKVNIRCKIHGIFEQTPSKHINGKAGCPKCQGLNKSTEEFIEQSIRIHGEKYTYDKTEYIHSKKKVIVTCKIHGDFKIRPNSLLRGQGCSKCADNEKLTTELFIEKSKKLHGDLYDYSQSVYVDKDTKVAIICKKHGVFFQKVADHLSHCGCQTCNKSSGERAVAKILTDYGVSFKEQVWFNDCRNIYPYRFDFGIYENNSLKCIIEFNGEQHYRVVYYRFADKEECIKKHNDVVASDRVKRDYCKDKNIPLLDIKYDDKGIDKLILKFLEQNEIAFIPLDLN